MGIFFYYHAAEQHTTSCIPCSSSPRSLTAAVDHTVDHCCSRKPHHRHLHHGSEDLPALVAALPSESTVMRSSSCTTDRANSSAFLTPTEVGDPQHHDGGPLLPRGATPSSSSSSSATATSVHHRSSFELPSTSIPISPLTTTTTTTTVCAGREEEREGVVRSSECHALPCRSRHHPSNQYNSSTSSSMNASFYVTVSADERRSDERAETRSPASVTRGPDRLIGNNKVYHDNSGHRNDDDNNNNKAEEETGGDNQHDAFHLVPRPVSALNRASDSPTTLGTLMVGQEQEKVVWPAKRERTKEERSRTTTTDSTVSVDKMVDLPPQHHHHHHHQQQQHHHHHHDHDHDHQVNSNEKELHTSHDDRHFSHHGRVVWLSPQCHRERDHGSLSPCSQLPEEQCARAAKIPHQTMNRINAARHGLLTHLLRRTNTHRCTAIPASTTSSDSTHAHAEWHGSLRRLPTHSALWHLQHDPRHTQTVTSISPPPSLSPVGECDGAQHDAEAGPGASPPTTANHTRFPLFGTLTKLTQRALAEVYQRGCRVLSSSSWMQAALWTVSRPLALAYRAGLYGWHEYGRYWFYPLSVDVLLADMALNQQQQPQRAVMTMVEVDLPPCHLEASQTSQASGTELVPCVGPRQQVTPPPALTAPTTRAAAAASVHKGDCLSLGGGVAEAVAPSHMTTPQLGDPHFSEGGGPRETTPSPSLPVLLSSHHHHHRNSNSNGTNKTPPPSFSSSLTFTGVPLLAPTCCLPHLTRYLNLLEKAATRNNRAGELETDFIGSQEGPSWCSPATAGISTSAAHSTAHHLHTPTAGMSPIPESVSSQPSEAMEGLLPPTRPTFRTKTTTPAVQSLVPSHESVGVTGEEPPAAHGGRAPHYPTSSFSSCVSCTTEGSPSSSSSLSLARNEKTIMTTTPSASEQYLPRKTQQLLPVLRDRRCFQSTSPSHKAPETTGATTVEQHESIHAATAPVVDGTKREDCKGGGTITITTTTTTTTTTTRTSVTREQEEEEEGGLEVAVGGGGGKGREMQGIGDVTAVSLCPPPQEGSVLYPAGAKEMREKEEEVLGDVPLSAGALAPPVLVEQHGDVEQHHHHHYHTVCRETVNARQQQLQERALLQAKHSLGHDALSPPFPCDNNRRGRPYFLHSVTLPLTVRYNNELLPPTSVERNTSDAFAAMKTVSHTTPTAGLRPPGGPARCQRRRQTESERLHHYSVPPMQYEWRDETGATFLTGPESKRMHCHHHDHDHDTVSPRRQWRTRPLPQQVTDRRDMDFHIVVQPSPPSAPSPQKSPSAWSAARDAGEIAAVAAGGASPTTTPPRSPQLSLSLSLEHHRSGRVLNTAMTAVMPEDKESTTTRHQREQGGLNASSDPDPSILQESENNNNNNNNKNTDGIHNRNNGNTKMKKNKSEEEEEEWGEHADHPGHSLRNAPIHAMPSLSSNCKDGRGTIADRRAVEGSSRENSVEAFPRGRGVGPAQSSSSSSFPFSLQHHPHYLVVRDGDSRRHTSFSFGDLAGGGGLVDQSHISSGRLNHSLSSGTTTGGGSSVVVSSFTATARGHLDVSPMYSTVTAAAATALLSPPPPPPPPPPSLATTAGNHSIGSHGSSRREITVTYHHPHHHGVGSRILSMSRGGSTPRAGHPDDEEAEEEEEDCHDHHSHSPRADHHLASCTSFPPQERAALKKAGELPAPAPFPSPRTVRQLVRPTVSAASTPPMTTSANAFHGDGGGCWSAETRASSNRLAGRRVSADPHIHPASELCDCGGCCCCCGSPPPPPLAQRQRTDASVGGRVGDVVKKEEEDCRRYESDAYSTAEAATDAYHRRQRRQQQQQHAERDGAGGELVLSQRGVGRHGRYRQEDAESFHRARAMGKGNADQEQSGEGDTPIQQMTIPKGYHECRHHDVNADGQHNADNKEKGADVDRRGEDTPTSAVLRRAGMRAAAGATSTVTRASADCERNNHEFISQFAPCPQWHCSLPPSPPAVAAPSSQLSGSSSSASMCLSPQSGPTSRAGHSSPVGAGFAAPLPRTEPPFSGPRLHGRAGKRGEMEIGAFLGGGACGRVYECLNTETGELLAVKQIVYNEKDRRLKHQLRQLAIELEVMDLSADYPDEGIVAFHCVEKRGHTVLIYMEYCEQGSLLDYMLLHGSRRQRHPHHPHPVASPCKISCPFLQWMKQVEEEEEEEEAAGRLQGRSATRSGAAAAAGVAPCSQEPQHHEQQPGGWNTSQDVTTVEEKEEEEEEPDGPALLPLREVQHFTRQITAAIHFLHTHRYAHLDVKTANVLITGSGDCRLADFGCAARLVPAPCSSQEKDPSPTPPALSSSDADPSNAAVVHPSSSGVGEREGVAIATGGPAYPVVADHNDLTELRGTALYMAPEMIRLEAHTIGTPADVWSLGCVLMELATGQAPWRHLSGDKLRVLFMVGSAVSALSLPPDLLQLAMKEEEKPQDQEQQGSTRKRWQRGGDDDDDDEEGEEEEDLGVGVTTRKPSAASLKALVEVGCRSPERSRRRCEGGSAVTQRAVKSEYDRDRPPPSRKRVSRSPSAPRTGERVEKAPGVYAALLNFITQCTRVRPEDRPSAEALLQHAFLTMEIPE